MGIWNTKLFDNDTTCDIRDIYIEFLQEGLSDEIAYKKTENEFRELFDTDEEPLFWYAISCVQWKLGRLMPHIKEKALLFINENGSSQLWEQTSFNREKWGKTLTELKDLLMSPMPARVAVKPKVNFETNLWNIGDVYAYRLNKRVSKEWGFYGKYIILHKISEDNSDIGTVPRVQLYNKIFDVIPSLSEVENLDILPFGNAETYCKIPEKDRLELPLNVALERYKEKDFLPKHFTYIGNLPDKYSFPVAKYNFSNCYWYEIDDCFCEFYESWQKYFFTVDNGDINIYKRV